MQRGKLILVTGGARSGKSSFAEKLAAEMKKNVIYLATCEPLDEEMARRIDVHKKSRPSDWDTVEEPLAASSVIAEKGSSDCVILLDCLALLVSNLLLSGREQPDTYTGRAVLAEIERLAKTSRNSAAHVIIVTNEVDMGLVPEYPIGRLYRDVLGKANQIIAAAADEVYLLISGIPVDVKKLAVSKLQRGQLNLET